MLEAKHVVKTFDGFRALDGLTMTVPTGAVYGPQAVLPLLVQRPSVPIIQGDHLLSTPFHDVY